MWALEEKLGAVPASGLPPGCELPVCELIEAARDAIGPAQVRLAPPRL
jgi:hypothetical protein